MTDPSQFLAALQSARKQAQAGPDTVLDLLEQASGHPSQDTLHAMLRDVAGMETLKDFSAGTLDMLNLPASTARALKAVPIRLRAEGGRQGALVLAMSDPWDDAAMRRVAQQLPEPIGAVRATTRELLERWLGPAEPSASSLVLPGNAKSGAVTGPVVEFVDAALREAYARGASDIHFECNRLGVGVRLRCDGVLVALARMDDPARAEEVISRIKVLAQLDITERRLPQDGRFRVHLSGGDIDLRVSIIPSVFGEDAVLRLLDKAQLRDPADQVSLDLLGFDAASAAQIRELASLPHGMLLVTGPTGSGKTTTVYAALSEVNNGIEKIITIEDPVEYELSGVLQVPVNERKGLTFAKGLRSILRHDPDRILVGEIRDAETAEIAVQSALTGHQVLTTVHANSVFDVTGRFKHFNLDMFGFMAALNGVIVQRLVRCLCPHCVKERPASERERAWLVNMGQAQAQTVPLATGCERCGGTGYRGRRVIAEVHAIDDRFRDLVTTGSPVSALREHVYGRGEGRTLSQLGADMVVASITSAEEIKRVVGWGN